MRPKKVTPDFASSTGVFVTRSEFLYSNDFSTTMTQRMPMKDRAVEKLIRIPNAIIRTRSFWPHRGGQWLDLAAKREREECPPNHPGSNIAAYLTA
jgi:hypothetical protein